MLVGSCGASLTTACSSEREKKGSSKGPTLYSQSHVFYNPMGQWGRFTQSFIPQEKCRSRENNILGPLLQASRQKQTKKNRGRRLHCYGGVNRRSEGWTFWYLGQNHHLHSNVYNPKSQRNKINDKSSWRTRQNPNSTCVCRRNKLTWTFTQLK